MKLSEIIKELRLSKGLTQEQLSERAGLARSYVTRLEGDDIQKPSLDTVHSLAKGLEMSPIKLCTLIYEEGKSEVSDAGDVVELPLLGNVPAGYPWAEEEEERETIFFAVTADIRKVRDMARLYVIKISGNSLIGDGVESGDLAVIDPLAPYKDGQIYIVRIGNEVVARHVYFGKDSVKLIASNGDYREMDVRQVEILGRIIMTGNWKTH
jgi:SOS-response transcriptional repressor LexA